MHHQIDSRISATELLYAVTEQELNTLCEVAASFFQVRCCAVKIRDAGHFRIKGSSGAPEALPEPGTHYCLQVMESREPLLISELMLNEAGATGNAVVAAYAGYPLCVENQPVGVFCLTDQRPHPDFQEAGFRANLARFSALAAAVLTAAYLRMRAAARPDIFRQSPFGMLVWHMGPVMRITYVSDQARTLLGDDLFISATDSGFLSLLTPDDALAYQRILSHHRAPDTAEQELTFQLKDKPVWISQFSYPEYDTNGHLQSVYCYLLNATAQKAVEQQLERARLEMYVRLDSVAIGTWSYDPQTEIRRVSPRMAEILGFPAEELRITQRDWVALMHPDDRAYVSAATQEELQNRQRFPNEKPRLRSVEYRIRNREGVYIWVQSGGAFIESIDTPGRFVLLGSYIDITARKHAESALNERRTLLNIIQQAQQQFMLNRDLQAAFDLMLSQLLTLLQCSLGCIALVRKDASGRLDYYLSAVLDVFGEHPHPALNGAARTSAGLESENLLSELMREGRAMYFNTPAVAQTSFPEGMPQPENYLGIPVFFNGELTGLLALANRSQGFSNETIELLSPVVLSLGALIHTRDEEEKRMQTEAQLARLAVTDTLTGILNRRGFFEKTTDFLALFRRYGTPSTMAIIDIDFFKRVNDRYGHTTGDEVLRSVAAMLNSGVRDTDVVARFGGEEFVILFAATGIEQIQTVMERIRVAVASVSYEAPGRKDEFFVTISAGLAQLTTEENTVDKWIAAADVALYQAKEQGRNRVVCFMSGGAGFS